MTQLVQNDTGSEAVLPKPPLSRTVRRQGLLLLALLSLLSSAFFFLSSQMKRSYEAAGVVRVSAPAFEPLPDLQRLPELAVAPLRDEPRLKGVQATVESEGGGKAIRLAASAPSRGLAEGLIQKFAAAVTDSMRNRAAEISSSYRTELAKGSESLAAREQVLNKQIEEFRLKHRGVLPDDPTSVIAQFEKLNNKLDDKQQRQHMVADQIKRLEEYKSKRQAGNQNVAPPPPIAPAPQEGDASAAESSGIDPEVATLTAQLQLVNNQIDEQLNDKHRTEEHPYVKDLRTQQADLQKKLDGARQRVAAGKPAPAGIVAPVPAHAAASDASLAAAQQVDLELQGLQSENDTLDAEIRKLSAQRDVMQKDVDQVLPVRQEYEKLTKQLAATQKDQQVIAGRTEAFNHQFGEEEGKGPGPVDIGALTMLPSSALPTFPKLPLIYLGGIVLGLGAALVTAVGIHRLDHTFHTGKEAAASLGIPVLGVVSEIRTRRQSQFHRMWQSFLRPVVAVALVLLMIGSALACYRSLADAGSGDEGGRGMVASGASFFPGESRL